MCLIDRSMDYILQITKALMHDWMHALSVDGVMNLNVHLCFEQFIKAGIIGIYESFSKYVSHWKWPRMLHADHLSEIFAQDRRDKHRKAKHIKCQASDMLSMMPIVTLFATNVMMNLGINISDECNAWLALADLVDIVIASARITITPDKLRAAAEKFLQTFVTAWGFDWMTPKFHWLLHFGDILELFKFLLMCFCLERYLVSTLSRPAPICTGAPAEI